MTRPLAAPGMLLLLTLGFNLAACGSYGTLRDLPRGEQNITLGQLIANADRYATYRAGVGLENASGLLFVAASLHDTVTLGPRWRPATGAESLHRIRRAIERAQDWPGYRPRLYQVLGADGRLLGYLYSGWNQLTIRTSPGGGVRLGDIPDPPQYLGDGHRDGR